MENSSTRTETDYFGDMEPIRPGRARAELDRRQVSLRWLSGSVLTGVVSLALMGGALFAALDGRQQLAIPAQAYSPADQQADTPQLAIKGPRPAPEVTGADEGDSRLMMVSTVSREGDREVVKLKPFLHVVSPLAVVPRKDASYPAFDALAIFSENGEPEPVARSSDLIYGADVEGEVSIRTAPYPLESRQISLVRRQSTSEIEELVRKAAPDLNIGATALSSISYFDPARFSSEDTLLISSPGVTITAENMTRLARQGAEEYPGLKYEERIARIRSNAPIKLALVGEGISEADSRILTDAIASNLAADNFLQGDMLRIVYEQQPVGVEATVRVPARLSVYRGTSHLVSLTRRESGRYVYSSEPDPLPELTGRDASQPVLARSMPSVYDAIYRTALTEGMTIKQAGDLVRIFAFDVDFRAAISPRDEISVLLALEDDAEAPTEESEILYASIKLGDTERKYYRFLDSDTGRIDYYDETGKSAKQFLLRQAVPNGVFRSSFGMRRHPVTGTYKMHTGVDWAAPRGTPIVAAGSGVVEKAGWAGGYGRQTIIRHANGYETSYSHQSAFAKGIVPGARVRQGQVIGFVGSTGLSTGPHLHYEVIVNGNKVDPMRIKLPRGKVFKGEQLRAFETERDRIDALIRQREEEGTRFASN